MEVIEAVEFGFAADEFAFGRKARATESKPCRMRGRAFTVDFFEHRRSMNARRGWRTGCYRGGTGGWCRSQRWEIARPKNLSEVVRRCIPQLLEVYAELLGHVLFRAQVSRSTTGHKRGVSYLQVCHHLAQPVSPGQ